MAKEIRLSGHGCERGKQRAGLNTPALKRTAARALADGLRASDTKGDLRRYLDVISNNDPGRHPRVHGAHIFIFAENTLITVLHLPRGLRNAAATARRKLNANQEQPDISDTP